jgi:CRISPR/Cas system-associated exonuclease Cas4 (RecB family)
MMIYILSWSQIINFDFGINNERIVFFFVNLVMNTDSNNSNKTISSFELASYVVCPQAWWLKTQGHSQRNVTIRSRESKKAKHDWIKRQELSVQLSFYMKVAYGLLVSFVIAIFALDQQLSKRWEYAIRKKIPFIQSNPTGANSNNFLAGLPIEIIVMLLVLGGIIFLWDLLDRRRRKLSKNSGIDQKSEIVALKGSGTIPSKEFFSEKLNLRSTPQGLIKVEGTTIPVDIYPFGKKVKDRHVIQMIAHLRLIEENEGTKPPYGTLILGERSIKIKNSEEKQRWLESVIKEMRSIQNGTPALASPSFFKCKSCDVHSICTFSSYQEDKSKSDNINTLIDDTDLTSKNLEETE